MPIERVFLLKDQQATHEAILDKLDRAAAAVEPGGTIWFVFVGHGAASADGSDGVLVGSDAQQTAQGLYARAVKTASPRWSFARATLPRSISSSQSARSSSGLQIVVHPS